MKTRLDYLVVVFLYFLYFSLRDKYFHFIASTFQLVNIGSVEWSSRTWWGSFSRRKRCCRWWNPLSEASC